ncbi:diguanylate cyclase [Domibacillus iocasae]|uniref:GGDEF domain-containing protein n=1 Tax=Domibacillus iocasae TaxID=1714016 RepID=A0A1E7DR07_9BACI|nr:diguanylate cyclase [Domibacillus iocasae]OES45494.1 hypothetical protein BA724_01345 [Domibacillus iocasae]
MKRNKIKLILVFSIFLLLFFTSLNIFASYIKIKKTVEKSIAHQGLQTAESIAASMDIEGYKQFLLNPSKNQGYWEINKVLNDTREKTGALHVYTLAIDNPKVSTVMIPGMPKEIAEEFPIGLVCTVPEKQVKRAYEGKTYITEIINDPNYGNYISVGAPIKDDEGKIIGYLGMDVDKDTLNTIGEKVLGNSNSIIELVKYISITTIPFIILVSIVAYIVLQKLIKPIRDLSTYAQLITEKKAVPPPHIPDWYFELKELRNTILTAVDFYEKKANYAENESNIDPLTGCNNRRSLEKTINDLDMYSTILFDIDHFKNVNDKYGHIVGDEVLKYLTKLVKKETRKSDLLFRLGGEEFLIILPETDIEITQIIAERIRKTTETTISPTGKPITVSIGIGNMPKMANHFSELLNITDQALYKAKQEGRNKIVIATTLNNNNEKFNGFISIESKSKAN